MATGSFSAKASSGPRKLRFGEFLIDVDRASLYRGIEERKLRPKSFEVLRYLAERPRRLVTKGELISAVWPDSFVTDNSLVQCLLDVRRALGEDSQELIKTIARRGYLFEADVTMDMGVAEPGPTQLQVVPGSDAVESPANLHPSMRLWPVVAVLSLVVAAVALRQIPRLRTPDNITSLAVLPFQQMGGASRDEYLELGMADALITRLSEVKQLTVRPTSAVRQFSGTPDAVAAGKRLRVGAVVDGSVQRLDDRIRVSARLVRVADGKPLWANTYDEPFRDIFSVQDAVSTRIAAALSITLSGDEVSRLSRRYATNTEAYQLYIRGKFFWERRTVENLRKAIALYEQVIQKDPQYAPAYASLANCYGPLLQWHALRPLEGLPKIEAAARKALELDPNLSDGHAAMAAARFNAWDFPGAERESKRAIELNPSDALAHMWYGYYLGAVGRHADDLIELRRSLELDPLNLTANSGLGSVLFSLGRYDEAVEQEKRTLDLDPGFPMARSALARIHSGMGQYALAAGEMEQAHDLLGLASVQAESGNREAAKKTLMRYLQSYPADLPVPQMYVAGVYALLGDKEESFRRLERAYMEHDTQLLFLKSGRNLARLRPDPRYGSLIRRIELTP